MNTSLQSRRQRALKIVSTLRRLFPNSKIALKYRNPMELLVAVMLSAQATDKKVNEITAHLFKKYRILDDYLAADPVEFARIIKPIGLYRTKTKNILAALRIIKEKFKGKVPRRMDELLTLPGVARKTANVVLGNAYGIIEGIAVDTHVRRLSRLLGLTGHTDPVKIERDLMQLIPRSEWLNFNHRMVEYGRTYCPAKRHDHPNCPLTKIISSP